MQIHRDVQSAERDMDILAIESTCLVGNIVKYHECDIYNAVMVFNIGITVKADNTQ